MVYSITITLPDIPFLWSVIVFYLLYIQARALWRIIPVVGG